MHNHADLGEVDAMLAAEAFQAVLDGHGKIRRSRRDLEAGDVVRRPVVEREVGEGATDVDAEPVTPHVGFPFPTLGLEEPGVRESA
jgi:hypothetical protein